MKSSSLGTISLDVVDKLRKLSLHLLKLDSNSEEGRLCDCAADLIVDLLAENQKCRTDALKKAEDICFSNGSHYAGHLIREFNNKTG